MRIWNGWIGSRVGPPARHPALARIVHNALPRLDRPRLPTLPPTMSRAAKPSPRSPARGRSGIENRIHRSIADAIADRRLPPGTRLVEERLAEVFGASRERVRKVLLLLAQERMVTHVPNRGAVVATPTVHEAREVFEARRVIERAIAERLDALPRPLPAPLIARLRQHLAREEAAEAADDRRARIRLSGEFHQLLAEAAGNSVLSGMLDGLIARTGLAIAAFERRTAHDCAVTDHRRLIDALEQGDGSPIARLMDHHLRTVEAQLDLDGGAAPAVDLRAVFLERG